MKSIYNYLKRLLTSSLPVQLNMNDTYGACYPCEVRISSHALKQHCKLTVHRCNDSLILLTRILKRFASMKKTMSLFTPNFLFPNYTFFTKGVSVLTYHGLPMVT